MIIESHEIKNLLPHREPFLFLDKCEIIKIGAKNSEITARIKVAASPIPIVLEKLKFPSINLFNFPKP